MNSSWQCVFEDEGGHKAEIVMAFLGNHDIETVLISKKDSAYHFGGREVYVSPENVLIALKLINDSLHFE